jgi:transposase
MEAKAAGEDIQVPWTLFELRRAWNRAKHEVAPWWAQNSKEAYSSGLNGLARALKNWQDSKHGRRARPRMGFPKPNEVARRIAPPCRPRAAIGVDLGIRHLAVLSAGRLVPNPAPTGVHANHRRDGVTLAVG